jgi:hypothetical protein
MIESISSLVPRPEKYRFWVALLVLSVPHAGRAYAALKAGGGISGRSQVHPVRQSNHQKHQ